MEKIILVSPNESMKDKAERFKREFFKHKEQEINGSAMLDSIEEYELWLKNIIKNSKESTLSPNWIISSVFFAVRERDNKIIGIADLRHYLNDFLKYYGHIGYSVLPSERRKGYATEILRQILEYAKSIEIYELQLSCLSNNIGSKKSILKNGGVFIRSFIDDGKEANIYKITL